MTDAEYERVKAHVGPIFEKWAWLLHEYGWKLDLEWHRDPYPADKPHEKGMEVMFEATSSWRYLYGKVCIYTPGIDLDDADCVANLEKDIIHELCHHLVSEMREDEPDHYDHEERVCEMLARLFIRLKEQGAEAVTDG